MNIKGYCFISDDIDIQFEQKDEDKWPTIFGSIPEKGNLVQSSDGICLTVLNIIHYQRGNTYQERPGIRVVLGEPIIYLSHKDY